jgi:RND family efflux transporter MFP subunit
VGKGHLLRLVVWVVQAIVSLLVESQAAGSHELRAQLIPSQQTTLGAELPAKISALGKEEGERFALGEVLVEFDCELQEAQLEKARALLEGAQSQWEGHSRLAELNAIGQMELRSARAELKKAGAEVAYLEVVLNKCLLKAPFGGLVATRHVESGQFVQAGQPLLDLVSDHQLLVEFILPSQMLKRVSPGVRLTLFVEDTERHYPFEVLRLGARVDPVSQTIKAVGRIDGVYEDLLVGMSGYLVLN